MKIISIDDSKSVHAFLDECLQKTGHSLTHAYDGQTGIDLITKMGPTELDLILLDWEMPGLSGPEVVQILKKQENRIPIIMMTSKSKMEEIQTMLSLGVREYIMKPFDKDILLEKFDIIKY